MKNLLTTTFLIFIVERVISQCAPNVPTYVIDLSSNADTTWQLFEADALDRQGQCCGVPTNQSCIRFEITLNPNAAGIFFDYDGASAFGTLNWMVDCGTPHDLRDTICVTDPGPFTLTFCKPGTDNGNYTLISIPKPTFPDDQFVPRNCMQPVEVLGCVANSVTWQSISPGTPGQYNGNLSCTNCLEPTFTPSSNSPNEIQYQVCGYPILDYCVGNVQFCDTVKFTIQDSLQLSISPAQPQFCAGGSVTLTALASGGDGNYSYIWYNSSLQVVGTGVTYQASSPGNYTCEVRDGNYELGFCDDFFENVTVIETLQPVVNAGSDQMLCATSPNAIINGSYQNATNISWSGGSGTFQNGNSSASNIYIPSQNDLSSGSVTLTFSTVGIGGGCSNTSDALTIFFVDTVETNLTDLSLQCKNGDITVNPVISGGMSPLSYSWSDGTNTSINTLMEGTHCLTITDANGCQVADCINVISPASIDVVTSSMPVSTNGGSDGSASISVSGGVGPYSYLWSNGGTSSSISNLSYGMYTVTVTDANGCERTTSVVVNEPRCNGFFVSTSSSAVQCFNGTNGSASLSVSGGTAPFTYLWNDPQNQTSANLTNLSAGIYTVQVTDATGCIALNTATVNEPDQLTANVTHTNVTVQNGNDGSAQVNAFGGTGGYSVLWSNGSSNNSISNLIAGLYSVSVSDANGCTISQNVQITQPPCNEFQANIIAASPDCNGSATGSANLNLVNGLAPYSIVWSTGQVGVSSVSNLPAGFHSVQVTDAQGCQIVQTYGISEPSALSIGFNPTPSTCFGADNGTIDATINGGTYPYYSFSWSTGASTEDLINMAPGTYGLTVTDENGCTVSQSVVLTQPSPINVTFTHQDVSCYGFSDAWIDALPTGGTLPYNFGWSNGATTQDLGGIDVGGYILNLTDANNCSFTNSAAILITQPSLVQIQNVIVECPIPGENNTTVAVVPTGGNSDYSVSFDNGQTFSSSDDLIEQLLIGTGYDIIVSDINNCISSPVHIDIAPALSINSVDFNKCYGSGQLTEMVAFNVSGGTAGYMISTDNGSSYLPVDQLSTQLAIDNNYQIVVSDANGCMSLPSDISLPGILSESTSIISDYNGMSISCFNMSDGEAQVVASGGTIPYTMTWSNGQSGAFATNLSSGTYTVVVKDSNGCEISGSVTLIHPDILTASALTLSDFSNNIISCHGAQDGQLLAAVAGGTGPYSFEWINGADSDTISNLPAGFYSVEVTDLNGCSAMDSITIFEPAEITVDVQLADVSCNGSNDGFIDVTVSGGTQPYFYDWNNGENSQDLTTLSEGSYSLTIYDANGCIHVVEEMVVSPNSLDIAISETPVSCYNLSDGSLEINCTGGTLPYIYEWSTGDSTQNLSGLSTGSYNVVVTDANGCWTIISGEVAQPDSIVITGNNSNPTCYGEENAWLNVEVSGGTEPYLFDWSNGQSAEDLSQIGAGTYFLTLTDQNNCVHQTAFYIPEPDPLSIDLNSPLNFHDDNITYHGGSDGSIETTVTGGTAPYTYSWSNNGQTLDQENLVAGVYYLTITDANGCKSLDSIRLFEPDNFAIPTIFTPNEDGDNDVFEIRGLEAYPFNQLTVVNRWGNIVFEQKDYNNTWKGTRKTGEELPDGVYFVIFKTTTDQIESNTYVHIKRH